MSAESAPKQINPNLGQLPVETLPDELLTSIFELCLPTENDYSPYFAYDRFPLIEYAPISVMHVCSRWRKTVISNSKLWSVLYLGTHKTSERNLGLLKGILAVWEERSRRHLVIISLSLLPPHSVQGKLLSNAARLRLHRQAWASLLPTLSRLLAHCKRLEIGRSSEVVLRAIEASDSIQELVCLDDIHRLIRHLPHPRLSTKLLRLHTFECRIDGHDECLSISHEDLLGNARPLNTKLRRVVLAGQISTQNFVLLATAVPTLEELDVRVLCAEGSQDMGPSHPTLSSPEFPPPQSPLIRLSLEAETPSHSPPSASHFHHFLNDLSFPHLRHLRLCLAKTHSPNEAVFRCLAAVLCRSQSPVESLRLSWSNPQKEDTIEALLRAVPRLVCLHLYFIDSQDVEVVTRAFMTTTTELIFPHLKCISFESIEWVDPEESARSLLEFISTRFAAPGNKLSRLVFVNPGASSGDDDGMGEVCAVMTGSAQFDIYRERGLELQTVYEHIEYV